MGNIINPKAFLTAKGERFYKEKDFPKKIMVRRQKETGCAAIGSVTNGELFYQKFDFAYFFKRFDNPQLPVAERQALLFQAPSHRQVLGIEVG